VGCGYGLSQPPPTTPHTPQPQPQFLFKKILKIL
jgi:hypothetical protein